MTTETQATPGEVAEISTPAVDEASPEATPEVVAPETDEVTAKAEPEESEEAKALRRMQRRIDKRTADVYRERAEKEQLAQRLAQLEGREKTEEVPKDFEAAVKERAREIARAEAFNSKCNSIAEAGKKLEGFDTALKALAEEVPLFDRSGRPTPLMEVALESDKPEVLLHYLGKNPDVAADLADLTPTQLARRLDRIERDLAAPPKTSKAPAPIEPLGAGKSQLVDMTTADFKTYEQLRLKQKPRWAR